MLRITAVIKNLAKSGKYYLLLFRGFLEPKILDWEELGKIILFFPLKQGIFWGKGSRLPKELIILLGIGGLRKRKAYLLRMGYLFDQFGKGKALGYWEESSSLRP